MPMFFDPPYFLLFFGLFAGLTSGIAFQATLKEQAMAWKTNRSTRSIAQMRSIQLKLPFWGITIGIGIFLTAGLEVFGFPPVLAFGVAIPLTIVSSLFIWLQLGSMLKQIETGGFKVLDLDSFE
jgi:hypothetical protein